MSLKNNRGWMPEEENKKTIVVRLPRVNIWMVFTLVLAVVLVLGLSGILPIFRTTGMFVLGSSDAAKKAVDYINENLVQTGSVTLKSVEEVGGMYKITTTYQGQEIPVFLTKDGKYLFVSEPFDITKEVTTTTTTKPDIKASCEQITKKDKAELEAFVVSYCPYGVQMQRILNEVVKNIPSLAANIKVRYIGSIENGKITAMHGDKEATENLRQICIREEQADKYWKYVGCFIKAGNTDSCLTEASIDKTKLDSCMTDPNKGVKYAQQDFDLQDEYGITGSPTLILNGDGVSEFNFGGRTAEAVKTLLCCGFISEPSVCSTQVSTQQAATSFSETYATGSSSSGTC